MLALPDRSLLQQGLPGDALEGGSCQGVPGARAPATPPEEDALARQDRLLRESPRADYVVEVDKTHDRAVAFERMQDGYCDAPREGGAKRCRRSLYLMNDILAEGPARSTRNASGSSYGPSTASTRSNVRMRPWEA